ncbi:MAG: type II toxin-antitoxin system VapC family toxin [Oscillospiraceae bacterium]|nr:type II toxin-antitoxin system VapC family toxin [Oscillospiraceae bacterium]
MFLLDSHIYLWFVDDDKKLPQKLKNIIENSDDVYVSIITFWELTIKSGLGKLSLPCEPSKMITDCDKLHIRILDILPHHLDILRTLEPIHRDPFDRMIISQAMAEDLTLITADEKILMYDCVKTLSEQGGSQ